MAVGSKPLILICSTPVYGHLMPIVSIAKAFIARGYEVTFCTGSVYKDLIQATGATFVPLEGYCDYTEADLPTKFAARAAIPPGPVQFVYDMENIFVRSMESQWQSQQKALRHLKETKPGRQIALLTECGFLGSVPTYLGAPGVQPSATIGIGVIPLVLSSIDLPPIGPGLPPDSTPEGRKRNIAGHKQFMDMFSSPMKLFQDTLKTLGAGNEERFFLDSTYLLPDRFVQMCLPSVEYTRSDAPSSIRFAGKLPPGGRVPMTNPPAWWSDIAINSDKKKIVFVCQGTVATNIEELIVPTMLAFKDSEDVIVVVALGKVGAVLPLGTPVPANARVAGFIPFDDVLPYCDAFVTNGGYGGFQHGVGNGIPMVLGGATEDKPEVAARAEWCGVGINLRTATPTPEVLKEAVTTIFSDHKYKKRALELQEESKAYDPISVLIDNMNEVL